MTTTDLAARYGTPTRRHRRTLLVSVVAVALVFAGWLAWVTVVQATPKVASGDLVYDPGTATENSIDVSFTVDFADDVTEATCSLKAQAQDKSLVGALSFTVTPGQSRVETTIATERRAGFVELLGCTAPGQNRPR